MNKPKSIDFGLWILVNSMNNGANSIIIKRTLKNDFYSTLKPLIVNIIRSIIIQSLTS